jgi:hypothetical protein
MLGVTIGLSSFGTRIATDLDLTRAASTDESASSANAVFDPDVGIRP